MDKIKPILLLFPVMGYYLIESIIMALFISPVWKLMLQVKFDMFISYWEWVFIIWIIKVIFFDVFKLVNGLNSMNGNAIGNVSDEIIK